MATFPEQDLELTARAAFGADLTASPNTWEWTDLSDRVIDTPLTVTHGVLVGAGTAKTGGVTGLTLLNDDGYLTPFLATSPYFPCVDAGTPFDLAVRTNTVPHLSDGFGRTVASGWGAPDSGPNWANTSGLSVSGGKGLISVAATNTIIRVRSLLAPRDTDITFTASIPAVATGQPVRVGPQVHDDTGAGTTYLFPVLEFGLSGVVRLALYAVTAGLPALVSQSTTALTYTSGTDVSAKFTLIGDRLHGRAWLAAGTEPTTWDYVETVAAAYADAGLHTNVGAWVPTSNTNSLPLVFSVDNITVQQPRYPRAEMYIADVQPSFRPLGDDQTHSVAVIKLGGVGSRLEKLDSPAESAMRRAVQSADEPPIAHWPLEDKTAATGAASAFDDQPPMVVTGPAVFGVEVGRFELGEADPNLWRYGAPTVVSLAAGAKLSGPVPLTTSTAWTVSMVHMSSTPDVGGAVTEMRLMEWKTPSGTHSRWALVGTLTGYQVRAYNDSAGTSTNVATYAGLFPSLLHYSVTGTQNGGNIDIEFLINANVYATGSVAGTIGAPTWATANPDQTNTTGSVSPYGIRFLASHITVHDEVVVALPYYGDGTYTIRADRGWAYEMAHLRGQRTAGEADVPYRVLGDPETSGPTRLNAQPEGGTVDLMKQAVDSESGGLLLDGEFGWLHIPRTGRYNRPVDLTVDMAGYRYSAGTDPTEVLVPRLDARGPNRWTVQRTNGSEAVFAAPKPFRDRRGTIDDKAVLDVLYDADCGPHASWRTHLSVDGTGANYPNTSIDLAANPDLIDDWLLCRIGARIQRTNQPVIAGSGVIDQIADGITETIGRRTWSAALDCSPAAVWDTGVWDDPGSLWQATRSTLTSGIAATGVATFSVTAAGEPWATGVVDLLLQVDTEHLTVDNISGSGPYTFTVAARSVNGVSQAHLAGAQVTLVQPGTWAI